MKQKFISNIICILAVAVLSRGAVASAGYPSVEAEDTIYNIQETENNGQDLGQGEVPSGWQEIEGKKYYFSLETGEMLSGLQEIEGKKYYFSLETGEMLSGLQEIEENKHYFSLETGEMLLGRQVIDNKDYYFNEDGIMQAGGLVETEDGTYYCGKNGVLASGWKKIKGLKYYFHVKDKKMVTGLNKIKGNYYIFDSKGRLAQSDGISIVKVNDSIYCANPDGKAASGWQVKRNKLYSATRKGRVRRNTTYQGIVLTKTGAAKKDINSMLKIRLIKVLKQVVNEKMPRSKKLYACWRYITSGKFRYASKYPDLRLKNWPRKTAYNMLATYSGNCYSYACAFAAMASELGYKPYIVCGRVHGSRDRAPDGYTRHAWVKINGRHYDPEGQYAGWLRGVYGRNGYPAAHKIQKIVVY